MEWGSEEAEQIHSTNMSFEAKGEALEKQAAAACAPPTGLFAGLSKMMNPVATRMENAAALYKDAAAQYKRASAFGRAGDAHVKQAECYKAADSITEASGAYKDACTMYKKSGDIKKAVGFNVMLAEMYEEKSRTSQAAKVYGELSLMYQEINQDEDAILSFESQARCYVILDQSMHEIETKTKLADLCAKLERYPKAIELYEEVAEPRNGRPNNRANEIYWKAMLCHMVNEIKTTGDIKMSAAHLTRYADLSPNFDKGVNRRNYVLLQKLFDAFAAESKDQFEIALQEHERAAGTLTAWDIKCLGIVKDSLENPSMGDAVGAGEEDEPDWS